jgi:DNA-binding XRE family transcriptional regulator
LNTNKLKSLRVLKGYTQQVMAKKADMSTKTFNRKELGLIPFTGEEIVKISSILSLDINLVDEIFFDGRLTKCISGNQSFEAKCINS